MKIILIMGLPGSGKTTLANKLGPMLNAKILNADEVRKEFDDWDFSHEGRVRQAKRMATLANKFKNRGEYVVADFICPTLETRELFPADYIVWVNTIKEGRFEDTNKMFVKPEVFDLQVTTQDVEKWVLEITSNINKNYKIYKNFVSIEECNILSNWIIENKDDTFFKDAKMKGKRLTTRYSDNFVFPKLAYGIQNKIIKKLNLKNYYLANFKDGMVASYAEPGDTCYIHKDPVWVEDTITLHCNIKLSDHMGGSPIIEGKEINLNKGDMWLYPVSDVNHGSNIVKGISPRTLWIFGFSILKQNIKEVMNNDC